MQFSKNESEQNNLKDSVFKKEISVAFLCVYVRCNIVNKRCIC